MMLRRITAPHDVALQLRPEPDDRIVPPDPERHEQRAAAGFDATFEGRISMHQIVKRNDLSVRQLMQLCQHFRSGSRRWQRAKAEFLARQLHNHAACIDETEQRRRVLGQPVQNRLITADGTANSLQLGLPGQPIGIGFRLAKAADQQRQHLAEQRRHGSQFGCDDSGGIVMADEHAPQAVAMHDRDCQAGGDIHVAHVLAVDRRDAAQAAQGHVDRHTVVAGRIDEQRHGTVAGVGDDTDPVADVKHPRLRRDVVSRVGHAQKGLQRVDLRFGDDLALTFRPKAIGHDTVKAGGGTQSLDGKIAQIGAGLGRHQGFKHIVDRRQR